MTDLLAPSNGMSRRNLLIGGGFLAAVATVGTRALLSSPTALERLSASAAPTVSVGFVDRVVTNVADLAGLRVNPAGDARPDSRVSLWQATVVGATPGFDEVVGDGDVSIEALFDNNTAEAWPFLAWAHRGGSTPNTSNASSFMIPAAPFGVGARLTVTASDTATSTASVVLSTQNRAGLPALREGTYLFALAPSTWDRRRTLPSADTSAAWSQTPSLAVSFRPA